MAGHWLLVLLACVSEATLAVPDAPATGSLQGRHARFSPRHLSRVAGRRSCRGERQGFVGRAATKARAAAPAKQAVVVGGGWGGFGAMKALTEAGYNVKLVDATPDPAALKGGWKNPNGRPVEAGFKGFWWQYPNIFSLVDELGLKEDELFTPLTRSGLYNPQGLFTEAPLFSTLPRLPAPFGQALYTLPLFRDLPLEDRLTISGLLIEMTRYKSSEETYKFYDNMTAAELFRRAGVSPKLIEKFLRPILLVGLFNPPEALSAALVMDMLYYYAIGHQADFDVKWARAPIAEALLAPFARHMMRDGESSIEGSSFVEEVVVSDGRAQAVRIRDAQTKEVSTIEADVVVLAVGVNGLRRILTGSPSLAKSSPDLRRTAGTMKGIDVMATRIWFDRPVQCPFPSNVFANYDELEGAGGTFFCLDVLHDDPWHNHTYPHHRDGVSGSVIAADFYNAGNLLSLPDEEIIRRVTKVLLPSAVPGFSRAEVVDTWVQRFPAAVTHFAPGTAEARPPVVIPEIPNLVVAGDHVRGLDHGSAGLCQERAYVSGLAAANQILKVNGDGPLHPILDVEADEPQFAALQDAAKTAEKIADSFGLAGLLFRS